MNKNTFVDNFLFLFKVFLSHYFFLPSTFLSSKPFQNHRKLRLVNRL